MANNLEIGAKAADGTLTIREAFSIRNNPGATINRIKAMGYDLDDNWSTVSTDKFLRDLNEQGKNAQFVELGATEQQLRRLAAQSKEGAEYSYKIGYGASGRASALELATAVQPRGTSEAGQSRVKPKAVPPAKDAIPAFIRGINAIPDSQTRAAVAFNFLVPLRPKEVGTIGIDDFDFETGQFKDEWRRGNKIRGAIELPEVALEILRDAHAEAVANGQSVIFDRTTAQMTAATKVPGGIQDQFKPYEKILGGGKSRPFVGASDIRKIIPSLMVGELKMGMDVSKVMGHATYDEMMGSVKKMTAANYISPIATTEGSAERQALSGLHNMMAEVMELDSLNELPAAMNVSATKLTEVGSPKLQVIPRGSDIVPTAANQNIGPLTEVDVELIEEVREARRAELRASTAALDLKATTDELANLELQADVDQTQIEAAVKKNLARKEATQTVKKESAKVAGNNSVQSMISSFGKRITNPDTLKQIGIGLVTTAASIPGFSKVAKPAELALEAAGAYGSAQEGASTREQLMQMGVDPTLATVAGTAKGVADFVSPVPPQPVVADPFSTRPIDRMAADSPEVAQSLLDTGNMEQPVNIPDPAPPAPDMAAKGFVPVPEARANAMRGETTTMTQSFLYGGVVN